MKLIFKQIIVIILTFIIILWFQNMDDKKQNIKRLTLFDKFKFPVLFSSIIGLLLSYNNIFIADCKTETNITLITPNFLTKIPQEIYTDLPDF